jgi:hypothetical protein
VASRTVTSTVSRPAKVEAFMSGSMWMSYRLGTTFHGSLVEVMVSSLVGFDDIQLRSPRKQRS